MNQVGAGIVANIVDFLFIVVSVLYLGGSVMTYLRYQNVKKTFNFKEKTIIEQVVLMNLILSVVVVVLEVILALVS